MKITLHSIDLQIGITATQIRRKNTYIEIKDYSTYYNEYKKTKDELSDLKSKNISSEITQIENKELKELINDYVSSADKILAKIIVDHESPFLKSIIILTVLSRL